MAGGQKLRKLGDIADFSPASEAPQSAARRAPRPRRMSGDWRAIARIFPPSGSAFRAKWATENRPIVHNCLSTDASCSSGHPRHVHMQGFACLRFSACCRLRFSRTSASPAPKVGPCSGVSPFTPRAR